VDQAGYALTADLEFGWLSGYVLTAGDGKTYDASTLVVAINTSAYRHVEGAHNASRSVPDRVAQRPGEGLPVAHGEAGVRSGDRSMPEERNRITGDQRAGLLLPPDERSAALSTTVTIPAS